MGFFDRTAICGVCNKEIGLNRFKVRKSDAWICPDCLKKAGGASRVNVSKLTIEEIAALVHQAEEKEAVRQEKLVHSPLNTAEGMYDYCLKNGYGSGWNEKWGVKHFKIIEDNLLPDEEIRMTFIGFHNYQSMSKHDGNFAYAITDRRILMGKKDVVGEKFQSISIDNINDITFRSGIALGIMTVDTFKEVFNVGLDKNSAQKINAKVHEVVDAIKREKSVSPNPAGPGSSPDAADEIMKFKHLLDMGAITQEEYDSKKKQLLDL